MRHANTYRGARRNAVRSVREIREWPHMGHMVTRVTVKRWVVMPGELTMTKRAYEELMRRESKKPVGSRPERIFKDVTRTTVVHNTFALTMQANRANQQARAGRMGGQTAGA